MERATRQNPEWLLDNIGFKFQDPNQGEKKKKKKKKKTLFGHRS
jgi:hypothetical protein